MNHMLKLKKSGCGGGAMAEIYLDTAMFVKFDLFVLSLVVSKTLRRATAFLCRTSSITCVMVSFAVCTAYVSHCSCSFLHDVRYRSFYMPRFLHCVEIWPYSWQLYSSDVLLDSDRI